MKAFSIHAVSVSNHGGNALDGGGEDGVRQILALFRKGIEGTLTLLACPSVGALDRSYVTLPSQ